MDFLKNPPPGGVTNRVVIDPVAKGVRTIAFHPFIEEFRHTISPKIEQQKFGLFAVSTYYRNGVSDNTYNVTLVLPAISEKDAENNYKKVQRFKKLLTPNVETLQKSVGLVHMKIGQLMSKKTGYITEINESFDLEVGFANGYPKLIRVSFTFAVDEMYQELFGGKDPIAITTGAQNQNANEKLAQTPGEKGKVAKAKDDLAGKASKPPRRSVTPKKKGK